jgi:hypothetical protein
MQATDQNITAVHPLERFLAILGALACLVITVAIWRSVSTYQGMWPLPGLYFVELAALSILSAVVFVRGDPAGRNITWAAAGIFLAFSILAGFSVGFFYLPIFLIFAIISVSSNLRHRQPFTTGLGICLIAGLSQAALILAIIQLLYPK